MIEDNGHVIDGIEDNRMMCPMMMMLVMMEDMPMDWAIRWSDGAVDDQWMRMDWIR